MTTIVSVSYIENVAAGLKKGLEPNYTVVHNSNSKDAAIKDLPPLFSGESAPRALVFAGPVPDADAKEIIDAIKAVSSSANIIRLTVEDIKAAGVTLPAGPPSADAPAPDPSIFTKLFKDRLDAL